MLYTSTSIFHITIHKNIDWLPISKSGKCTSILVKLTDTCGMELDGRHIKTDVTTRWYDIYSHDHDKLMEKR